jgi:S1-C subfamily serine protease
MSLADEQKKLLIARVRTTFGNQLLTTAFNDRKAIIGPDHFPGTDEGKLAQDALSALENGKDPDARGLAALQLMIKLLRPAPLIESANVGGLDVQAEEAFPEWSSFTNVVRPILNSIGRINDSEGRGVGTGFLIDEKTIITNAHVLSVLSRGTMVLGKGQATIDFRKEYRGFEEEARAILSTVAVDETHDLALLRIVPADGDCQRPLKTRANGISANAAVVAIGYPFDDPMRNPLFINGIFENIFWVKRAAPGRIIETSETVLTHDCSTLGGNSGSPLLSMGDGALVGVHREGLFMYVNSAVPAKIVEEFCASHAQ